MKNRLFWLCDRMTEHEGWIRCSRSASGFGLLVYGADGQGNTVPRFFEAPLQDDKVVKEGKINCYIKILSLDLISQAWVTTWYGYTKYLTGDVSCCPKFGVSYMITYDCQHFWMLVLSALETTAHLTGCVGKKCHGDQNAAVLGVELCCCGSGLGHPETERWFVRERQCLTWEGFPGGSALCMFLPFCAIFNRSVFGF